MQKLSPKGGRLERPSNRGTSTVALRAMALGAALLHVSCYATLVGDDEATESQSQYASGSGATGTGGEPPIEMHPLEPIPEEPVPYATAAAIIGKSCTSAKCHGRDEEPLITVDGNLPHFLTTTIVEECGNVPLVTPGDDTKSALVLLVTRQCGDLFMPDTCRSFPCLLSADLALLQGWIQQGAPMQ